MLEMESKNGVHVTKGLRRTKSMYERCLKSPNTTRSLIPVRQLTSPSNVGAVIGQNNGCSLTDLSHVTDAVFINNMGDSNVTRSDKMNYLVNGGGKVRQISSSDTAKRSTQDTSYLGKFKHKLSSFGLKALSFPKTNGHESSVNTTNEVNSAGKRTDSVSGYKAKTLQRSKTADSLHAGVISPIEDVQLKRCLSLYERKRDPHFCDHHQKHTDHVDKPPWRLSYANQNSNCLSNSYDSTQNDIHRHGSTTDTGVPKANQVNRRRSSTSSLKPHPSATDNSHVPKDGQPARPRSSTTSSRSSKLSMDSTGSSEFDFDHPPVSAVTPPKGNKVMPWKHTSTPRCTTVAKKPRSPVEAFTISGRHTDTGNNDHGKWGANTCTRVHESVATYRQKMSSIDKSLPVLMSSMSVEIRECITTQSFDACSQSSADSDHDTSVEEPAVKEEPDVPVKEKSVFVAEDEFGYPETKPVAAKRSDIFNARDFLALDQHVLQAKDSLSDSYDALLDYLMYDVVADISKVRAIYMWVVSQRLPVTVNKRDIAEDSPRGFLYNIRERRATYSELFALLCRRVAIPCVIIYGVAKSVAYDVGDRVTHKKMRNNWNAVYCNNCWHLVHPYWASQSAKGYNSGRWAVVESDSFHEEDGSSSRASIAHKPNDFFFLTEPEKFITKCFPDNPVWQLMHKALTKHEFEDLPFLQPSFYELKLKTGSHNKCVIQADNGKVEVTLQLPSRAEKAKRYKFKYRLYKHRDWEAEGEYDQILLDRYLLHHIHDGIAVFEIRFPVGGDYKLELHCHDPKRSLLSDWICDYKIKVLEAMENCQPLPIVPSIGWGPGLALEDNGAECLTHSNAIVSLDKESVTFIRFALPNDRDVALEANLLHNDLLPGELESHVTCEQDGEHALVQISPPSEGEFALQVFMKDGESDKRRNVCNYLLHRTKIVEDPELSDIRFGLIRAMEDGDPEQIQHWIDRFVEREMEDRGDLTNARKKLNISKLNRDIAEAIARKDLALLEKAMHSASDTSLRKRLGHLAAEAEAMRSRLRRLKRLRHAVLDMDQKTISEMRSYPKPPSAVHGVLAATFLLLGNREGELKKWSKIQALISKRGKEGLKRRVGEFQTNKVTPAILARAKVILSKYDLESVQIASTGAATFYQWAITMVGEVEQELDRAE